jgi:hypothetical protein
MSCRVDDIATALSGLVGSYAPHGYSVRINDPYRPSPRDLPVSELAVERILRRYRSEVFKVSLLTWFQMLKGTVKPLLRLHIWT